MLGCVMVYSALFGAGSPLYGATVQGIVLVVLWLLSAAALSFIIPRLWPRAEILKP